MVRAFLVAASLLAAGTAFADARADAIEGAVVDCFTTGEALDGVTGGTLRELNPVGAIAACALKLPMVAAADRLPEPDRTATLQGQRAIWNGAGAHNLALLAGAHAAAATGVGLLVAVFIWQRGAEEREFAQLCAIHERLAGHPMACTYTPPT